MPRKVLTAGTNPFQVHAIGAAHNTLFAGMSLGVVLFSQLSSHSYFLQNGFEQSSGTTSCVEKQLTERSIFDLAQYLVHLSIYPLWWNG